MVGKSEPARLDGPRRGWPGGLASPFGVTVQRNPITQALDGDSRTLAWLAALVGATVLFLAGVGSTFGAGNEVPRRPASSDPAPSSPAERPGGRSASRRSPRRPTGVLTMAEGDDRPAPAGAVEGHGGRRLDGSDRANHWTDVEGGDVGRLDRHLRRPAGPWEACRRSRPRRSMSLLRGPALRHRAPRVIAIRGFSMASPASSRGSRPTSIRPGRPVSRLHRRDP